MVKDTELREKMQNLIDVPLLNYQLGYRPMNNWELDRFVRNYIFFKKKENVEIGMVCKQAIFWEFSRLSFTVACLLSMYFFL